MIITDLVYEEIRDHLALHSPERGGALYGPKYFPAATHFEYDKDGETTAVSYVPSTRLIANVAQVEIETGLQLKGIIHSHPQGFTRPSEGDRNTAASFFRLNQHFAVMALPIVQQIRKGEDHAQDQFIHWFRAERRANRSSLFSSAAATVEIIEEDFFVLPLWEHVTQLVAFVNSHGFKLTCERRIQSLKFANAQLIGLVASDDHGHEFMYFVALDYPVVPPIVLFQRNSKTESLKLYWDGLGSHRESLVGVAMELADEWRAERGGN